MVVDVTPENKPRFVSIVQCCCRSGVTDDKLGVTSPAIGRKLHFPDIDDIGEEQGRRTFGCLAFVRIVDVLDVTGKAFAFVGPGEIQTTLRTSAPQAAFVDVCKKMFSRAW